jgi:hypothetical protein
VWRVGSRDDVARLRASAGIRSALDSPDGLIVQAQAAGSFEQAHAIFDQGRLVAVRTDRRLVEGTNGGPALKLGVLRPLVSDHLRLLGRELAWRGGFSVDYFWGEETGRPDYVDANPRLTEPVNSLANGLNLADLQVRLAVGDRSRHRAAPATGGPGSGAEPRHRHHHQLRPRAGDPADRGNHARGVRPDRPGVGRGHGQRAASDTIATDATSANNKAIPAHTSVISWSAFTVPTACAIDW